MAERMQLLQQARRIVEQNSGEASQKYKKVHDRTATEHNLQVGDKPDDGDYPMPVLNDAVIFSCTTGNTGNLPDSSGDLLGQWTFLHKCQLPACQDSCKQNTKQP